MRFIAAIDTNIFGVPVAQGADIDISGWTRRQVLQYLDNGTMSPSHLSPGAVEDALEFRGEGGVEIEKVSAIDRSIIIVRMTQRDLSWLTDVNTTGREDGDVLVYDEPTGHWRPETLTIAANLSELDDVDVTDIEEDWILVWSALEGKWRAQPAPTYGIDDLTDVEVAGAMDGQALIYDFSSGTWMPGNASSVPGPTGPVAWAVPVPWSGSTQYTIGPPASVVTLNGSTYVAIQSSLNRNPSTNPAYWRLVAAKGDKGDQGDTGPASTVPGPPGPANTISIGTVVTLGTGVPATATMGGVAPSQTLNLGLPRGEKGDKGDQGDPGAGATTVSELTDVDLTGLDDGYVLSYDETGDVWVVGPPASGGASAISDLTDVDLTGLADGYVLSWSGAAQEWVPVEMTGDGPVQTLYEAGPNPFVGSATNWGTSGVTFKITPTVPVVIHELRIKISTAGAPGYKLFVDSVELTTVTGPLGSEEIVSFEGLNIEVGTAGLYFTVKSTDLYTSITYTDTGSQAYAIEDTGESLTISDASSPNRIPEIQLTVSIPPVPDPVLYADLGDVDLTGLAEGNVPTWDATEEVWKPQAPSSGALGSLSDVDLATTPPTTGDALVYDGTSWIPNVVGGGGGGGAMAAGIGVSNRSGVNTGTATGVRPVTYDTADIVDTGFTYNLGNGTITVADEGWYVIAGHIRFAGNYTSMFALALFDANTGENLLGGFQGDTDSQQEVALDGIAWLPEGTTVRMDIGTTTSSNTALRNNTTGEDTYLRMALLSSGPKGSDGVMGPTLPGGGTYTVLGELAVGTGTYRLYNDTGTDIPITKARLTVGQPPIGASVIVDINQDGTTIFTNQGERPELPSGTSTALTVLSSPVVWAAGSYLTVDVDQVGSSAPGDDLTLSLTVGGA